MLAESDSSVYNDKEGKEMNELLNEQNSLNDSYRLYKELNACWLQIDVYVRHKIIV